MKWIILFIIFTIIVIAIFYVFNEKLSSNDDELILPLVKYYEERIRELNKSLEKDSLINYVENPGQLPKIIHRINADTIKDSGRKISNLPSNITLEKLYGWKEIVYSKEDIDKILNETFGKEHRITKAYNMINDDYIVMRSDFFRYIICYLKGGLYLDLKSFAKNSLPYIPSDKEILVSYWGDRRPHSDIIGENGELINWFIYSKSGSKLLEETINIVTDNIFRLYENPSLIKQYDILKNEPPGKRIVIPLTGPIMFTLVYNSSTHKDKVFVYNTHNILDYCHPSCKIKNKKSHYSNLTSFPLISNNFSINIPKNIYMTYHEIEKIPQYVYNNLKEYCKGYNIYIYNDKECIDFLNRYYGKRYVDIFQKLNGPHKADFWRYCMLYIHGGVYFDIKTNFQIPIDEIFDHTLENTWYTIIDNSRNNIYNGIIATFPCNKIIGKSIRFILHNHPPINYYQYIRNLYTLIKKENYDNRPRTGENQLKNGIKVILLQEDCIKGNDKYGLQCSIQDKNQKLCFITRYDDFPWK